MQKASLDALARLEQARKRRKNARGTTGRGRSRKSTARCAPAVRSAAPPSGRRPANTGRPSSRRSLRLERLEERMMLHAGSHDEFPPSEHIHAQLTIFINGQYQQIPDAIGFNAANQVVSFLHTEGNDGLLHYHAITSGAPTRYPTVADFFTAWRNDTGAPGPNPNAIFNSQQILGNFVNDTHEIRMFVNGQPNLDFENYVWHDGDSIVISYTRRDAPASLTLVRMETVLGNIDLELYRDAAPLSVANFLNYVNSGAYTDSVVHRVVPNFIVQGGGFTAGPLATFPDTFPGTVPQNAPVQNEPGITNVRGMIAMAKLGGDPNSATNQWFVNLGNNASNLDNQNGGFTVFARVIRGMNVVDAIAAQPLFDLTGFHPAFTDFPIINPEPPNLKLENLVRITNAFVLPGEIRGTIFLDGNGNNVLDGSESGHAGWTAYLDNNNNGQRDAGEPLVVTNSTGAYSFTGLAAGSHTVRIESRSGFVASSGTGSRTTTLYGGQIAQGQNIGVRQLPAAPGVPDLAAASDTGISDTDNLTNLTTLQFVVPNVASGATVRLLAGNTLIGQATASGTSVTITTNNAAALTEGPHTITAEQVVGGLTSARSAALTVTIDTTPPPAITPTPPSSAFVGVAYNYDAQNPEEGTTGFRYSVVGAPQGLTINATTGVVSWTPTAAQTGSLAFEIRATDAAGNVRSLSAAITVAGALAALPDAYEVDEDNLLVIGAAAGVLANDGDQAAGPLTAQLVQNTTRGFLQFNSNGSFTYQPDPDFFGTDTFRYRASDGVRNSDVISVTLTVRPVNDAPSAANDQYAINSGATLNVAAANGVLANDTDPEGDSLTAQLFQPPQAGTLTLNANGSFTYVAPTAFSGTVTFQYRAFDGQLHSAPAAVTINVNNAPRAAADSYEVDEDDVLAVSSAFGVLANDADDEGDPLVAEVVSGPSRGTLTLNPDGSFVYTPQADYFGADSFVYRARDPFQASQPTTVNITVRPVNDAPIAAPETYRVDRGGELVVPVGQGVLINDSDPDGDTLAAQLVGQPQFGQVALAADGSFRYTPDPGFAGTDTFTYRASDGELASGTTTVTIRVNGPPTARPDAFQTLEDQVLNVPSTIGVLANDDDPEGDLLTAAVVTAPQFGTLNLLPDGSFQYTPNLDYFGADQFTYRASDGSLTSEPVVVTLTIVPVNDAPIAQPNVYTVDEDQVLSVGVGQGVLVNDSDVEGQSLIAVLAVAPQFGTLDLAPDGSFVYTPRADFFGTDVFLYQAFDGQDSSTPVSVTITVQPVDDPPKVEQVAPRQVVAGRTIGPLVILASDVDSATTQFRFELVDAPPGATIHPTTGVFTYLAPADASGTTLVTVIVSKLLQPELATSVTFSVDVIEADDRAALGLTPRVQGGSQSDDFQLQDMLLLLERPFDPDAVLTNGPTLASRPSAPLGRLQGSGRPMLRRTGRPRILLPPDIKVELDPDMDPMPGDPEAKPRQKSDPASEESPDGARREARRPLDAKELDRVLGLADEVATGAAAQKVIDELVQPADPQRQPADNAQPPGEAAADAADAAASDDPMQKVAPQDAAPGALPDELFKDLGPINPLDLLPESPPADQPGADAGARLDETVLLASALVVGALRPRNPREPATADCRRPARRWLVERLSR